MKKDKILEEKSKKNSEILVALFSEFTNSKRINKELRRNSSWIKGQIGRLRDTEYLEKESRVEKSTCGAVRRVPLVRLSPLFIFFHLDKNKFNKQEIKYYLKLIEKNRRMIAGTTHEESLYLNTFRITFTLLNTSLLDKSNKIEIKSRLLTSLAEKLIVQTIPYIDKSNKFRREWDNLSMTLVVSKNVKEDIKEKIRSIKSPH